MPLDAAAPVVYIVSNMPPGGPLGEFEVVVLMAVLQLRDDAYGSSIREEIERRTGRPVSRGAVYITLDRLEEKALLMSRVDGASGSRGGRPKRLFRVTPAGVKAVKHSLAVLVRMHKGLEPLLGEL
jgi:DNA-binding PadR family transcriptional regulator